MWLITKMKRPISDFEPIIAELIKGYIQTAEDFCEAIFDKKICELSEDEYIKFKNRIQFHLAFKYSDDLKPILISG